MSKITEFVTSIAAPAAEKFGCELWDVEYVKEAGNWFLRVYIDRAEGGVSLDHCESVSRELDPILDANEDMIPGSYTFEVSSAGAERPLRKPSDFLRFLGHLCEVKLYRAKNGQKIYTGILTDYDRANGGITLEISGVTYQFTKSEIAGVRLRISQV